MLRNPQTRNVETDIRTVNQKLRERNATLEEQLKAGISAYSNLRSKAADFKKKVQIVVNEKNQEIIDLRKEVEKKKTQKSTRNAQIQTSTPSPSHHPPLSPRSSSSSPQMLKHQQQPSQRHPPQCRSLLPKTVRSKSSQPNLRKRQPKYPNHFPSNSGRRDIQQPFLPPLSRKQRPPMKTMKTTNSSPSSSIPPLQSITETQSSKVVKEQLVSSQNETAQLRTENKDLQQQLIDLNVQIEGYVQQIQELHFLVQKESNDQPKSKESLLLTPRKLKQFEDSPKVESKISSIPTSEPSDDIMDHLPKSSNKENNGSRYKDVMEALFPPKKNDDFSITPLLLENEISDGQIDEQEWDLAKGYCHFRRSDEEQIFLHQSDCYSYHRPRGVARVRFFTEHAAKGFRARFLTFVDQTPDYRFIGFLYSESLIQIVGGEQKKVPIDTSELPTLYKLDDLLEFTIEPKYPFVATNLKKCRDERKRAHPCLWQTKICVRKLPSCVIRSQLMNLFDKYGRIYQIEIKGTYGFVTFESPKSARNALAEDGEDPFGKAMIQVQFADHQPSSLSDHPSSRPIHSQFSELKGRKSPSSRRHSDQDRSSKSDRKAKRKKNKKNKKKSK